MTGSEILGLVGMLLTGAAIGACAIVGAAKILNEWVYRWEARRAADDVKQRVAAYGSGRPDSVEFFRPRHARVRNRSRWS